MLQGSFLACCHWLHCGVNTIELLFEQSLKRSSLLHNETVRFLFTDEDNFCAFLHQKPDGPVFNALADAIGQKVVLTHVTLRQNVGQDEPIVRSLAGKHLTFMLCATPNTDVIIPRDKGASLLNHLDKFQGRVNITNITKSLICIYLQKVWPTQ